MVDFSPFRFFAVLALFVGHILLLGRILDRRRKSGEVAKSADPELASLNAELLVRRLGEMILRGVHAVAWLSGLIVLPLLIAFVYSGWWMALALSIFITLTGGVVVSWTSRKLEALKDGLLSSFL